MRNEPFRGTDRATVPVPALRQTRTRRMAVLALLTALAVLMGYVESLIPLNAGVPGIKIGICNIVVLFVLLLFSWKEALAVSAARVLIIGFLFGNLYSIAYGLAGTALSILGMTLLLKSRRCGLLGVSAAGGVLHNVGQILTAKLVLPSLPLLWYVPVLIFAGMAAGAVVGGIVYLIWKRAFPVFRSVQTYTKEDGS